MSTAEVDPRFAGLIVERDGLNEKQVQERKAMQAECNESLELLWKKTFPKKVSPGTMLACQIVPAIADAYLAWQEKAREMLRQQQRLQITIARKLADLAKDPEVTIPILPVDQKVRWKVSSTDTYRSQGFGQMKYAQQAAEANADKVKLHGLTPEIRRANEHSYVDCCHNTMHSCEFEVWVNTTELGLKLLELKPDVSLRDWVKSCWARGVNPRVYMGLLPNGYEEEQGLDYQGGERPKIVREA